MAKYNKVAGGQWGVYKPEPEPIWPGCLGAIVMIIIALFLIRSCVGG